MKQPTISLSDWHQSGNHFDYRGHAIFFRCTRSDSHKPALLLIHGFPTASWDWEALWEPLSGRFHLLTLDMIGFGFSAKPKTYAYSMFDQASLFEDFLKRQQVTDYHVLAHDVGDTVAQELLARQREPGTRPRLLSVCFLNGGLFPETHRALLIQKLLLSPLGPIVARLSSEARFTAALQHTFAQPLGEEMLHDFWTLFSRDDGRAVVPKLIRYMSERREHRERWVGVIVNSPTPLKVIDGAADPISGAHMVARYHELVPHPDTTLLQNVGHYPHVEAPDAVLTAYLDFVKRVGA